MTMNLFQTSRYRALMEEHLTQTILYLFDQNQEFAIACETRYVTFNPALPASILEDFKETVLFILKGYTFESAKIDGEDFIFEAGFGEENFGATVFVPLLAIKQLFVGEHPIIINMAEPAATLQHSTEQVQSSMEALLNNPENKKLLKRKK